MLNIKAEALTEKGAMRPAVREAVRGNIQAITITLANGSVVDLEYKGNGEYFAPVAMAADGTVINAKVALTITANDYKAPAPKKAAPKAAEVIEVE